MNLLDLIIHWLHLLAASIWVGGMVFVAAVLTPIARRELPPELRFLLFQKVGRRFSAFGWGALLLLVLTGAYKLGPFWNDPEFFRSAAGMAFLFKIILVIGVLILSYLHDFVWGPELAQIKKEEDLPAYRENLARVSFWARTTLAFTLLITICGAFIRLSLYGR